MGFIGLELGEGRFESRSEDLEGDAVERHGAVDWDVIWIG